MRQAAEATENSCRKATVTDNKIGTPFGNRNGGDGKSVVSINRCKDTHIRLMNGTGGVR